MMIKGKDHDRREEKGEARTREGKRHRGRGERKGVLREQESLQ